MKFSTFCRYTALACALVCGVAGCSGDGGDDPAEVAVPPADPVAPPVNIIDAEAFKAVDTETRTTFEALGIDGMGLAIYDAQGNKVFESMYGNFSPDQRVYIASASKLVSGVVLFRLIDQGLLSLDSTTAGVLGWTGDKGTITLRQLLSLKSGLIPENLCTIIAPITLAMCADEIHDAPLLATPGTRFDYGSTHLTVAGRMAEVVTGKAWNAIFTDELLTPLGLSSDIQYYVDPDKLEPTSNPLLAGGLVMSMNEYAKIAQLVFNKGNWEGNQLVGSTLFDLQAIDPYPNAEITGASDNNAVFHYGLAAWLECDTPATGCAVISSPGLFGFTPWIDRSTGYYAIIGMENRNLLQSNAAEQLQQRLKPLIIEALGRH